MAHHTDPATFVNLHFPRWKNILWTRDIDVSASDEFLSILSFKSGLTRDSLYKMTLKSYEGYLAEEINPIGFNRFIQPVANYGRLKTAHGLRYCPKCLAEDPAPYFRRKWRLAFSTACTKHGCLLLDRCPSCDATVNLYRCYYDDAFEFCCKCGLDFKRVPAEPVGQNSSGVAAISRMYEVLSYGVFRYDGGYMYSFLFFDIVYQVGKIVLRNDRAFKLLRPDKKKGAPVGKLRFLAAYPLRLQHNLFSTVIDLLQDFPQRLIEAFSSAGIRKCDLTRDMLTVPYSYSVVTDRFDLSCRMVSIEEVKSAIRFLKVRTPRVYKMWVEDLLGASVDLRKRRDLRFLFRKKGRFHLAA